LLIGINRRTRFLDHAIWLRQLPPVTSVASCVFRWHHAAGQFMGRGANAMDDDPSTSGVMIGLIILTFVLALGVCCEVLVGM
jgi:hypothetical protein